VQNNGSRRPRRHEKPQGRRIDRGRGYKRVGSSHVEVYDIDLAAWLHLKGVAIADAYKVNRESVITFFDPKDEDQISKLVVDWLNSEAANFASAVRQIKKVCLSTDRNRDR
jgi:hypothetical protein